MEVGDLFGCENRDMFDVLRLFKMRQFHQSKDKKTKQVHRIEKTLGMH